MTGRWLANQKSSYAGQHNPELSTAPVYLIAAEDDALRDDTLILAAALSANGRTITLDRVPNVDHGFLHGGEENTAAEAALTRFAAWLAAQQAQ